MLFVRSTLLSPSQNNSVTHTAATHCKCMTFYHWNLIIMLNDRVDLPKITEGHLGHPRSSEESQRSFEDFRRPSWFLFPLLFPSVIYFSGCSPVLSSVHPFVSPFVSLFVLHFILTSFSWYVSGWRPCSKTCGKGVQTREIACRQEVSRGQFNRLSDSQCSAQKPTGSVTEECNKIDCPPEKVPEDWSAVRRSGKMRHKVLRPRRGQLRESFQNDLHQRPTYSMRTLSNPGC